MRYAHTSLRKTGTVIHNYVGTLAISLLTDVFPPVVRLKWEKRSNHEVRNKPARTILGIIRRKETLQKKIQDFKTRQTRKR
jgi:hypothetical protein